MVSGIHEAARQIAIHAIWRHSREQLLKDLASIRNYLGTTDPTELVAAYMLELAGCERTSEQLRLDLPGE